MSKKRFFLFLQELKHKLSIIGTLGPLVRRFSQPTSGGATLSVPFLTCIKPRLLLPILKFTISNPFLQGSCVGINQCHSACLKSQQRQVLDRLSGKSKQRHSESIILYLACFIDHILGRLSTCYQLQASNHPHTSFHKINIDLKYKCISS